MANSRRKLIQADLATRNHRLDGLDSLCYVAPYPSTFHHGKQPIR